MLKNMRNPIFIFLKNIFHMKMVVGSYSILDNETFPLHYQISSMIIQMQYISDIISPHY